MRPITIPPFLDRVVQEAIKIVLYAIWEPDFERTNRSFGFRPNKSCHDAICALKSNVTNGLFTAIEGDIQSAYDNVEKKILLELLEKKIQDRNFIKLMSNRLNYDYVDKFNKSRVKPSMGIPQGGIDSPYLFNIYLHELDVFVLNEVENYLNELNVKAGFPLNKQGKTSLVFERFKGKITRKMEKISSLKKKQKTKRVQLKQSNLLKIICLN
jgi:retron-type reverse transcriptase